MDRKSLIPLALYILFVGLVGLALGFKSATVERDLQIQVLRDQLAACHQQGILMRDHPAARLK